VLIVSRRENESVRIEPVEGVDLSITLRELFADGPILVTLVHAGPRRVRLAVEAPEALRISRSELPAPLAPAERPEVRTAEGS
jgi:sRNA-binding carbon storage regulator CsrA